MMIVSYDITSNRSRSEFARFLKKYGRRMQYSVFEVRNSPRVVKNIHTQVDVSFKKKFAATDSVVVFPICEGCKKRISRYGSAIHDEEKVVVFG